MTVALTADAIEIDDDFEAFYELSLAEKWGDGAPLIPPTDARIRAMLAATPYPADHVLGALPPKYGLCTVELVAINAVMAGCQAKAFPHVIAAVEAVLRAEFNPFAILTTTSSVFPMLIVNGPGRDDLGVDYRAGCLGGAAGRGSMTIGRALSLCLRNIGGQRAGETSRTVFGQAARFGQCFGEWEERSPWPSLAQRRGFDASQDVVTAHAGKGNFPVADTNTDDAKDLAYLLAKSMAFPMANWYLGPTGETGQLVICINPIWADRMGKVFPNIEDLQAYFHEHAWQPIDLWRADNQSILRKKNRVDDRGRVYMANRPAQFVPVVCGGLGNLHAMILHSWCDSEMQSVVPYRHEEK